MTNVLTAFSCQRTFVIFFYLLNSDITGGVVHNYAFSCIHRHIGCRQRKCAWNLDGAHAVVVNAEPLLPYTVDLFCIEHFDFFHQFIQHPGCQLFCSGVLANQTDEHIRCHGAAALLFDFGAELFYFLCQFLLLVLIPSGHFRKTVVREFAGNIVLIDAFKQPVQFLVACKQGFQFLLLQLAVGFVRLPMAYIMSIQPNASLTMIGLATPTSTAVGIVLNVRFLLYLERKEKNPKV